jgi:hypothetical protein
MEKLMWKVKQRKGLIDPEALLPSWGLNPTTVEDRHGAPIGALPAVILLPAI